MAVITIEGYKCERCNHSWAPRANSKKNPNKIPIVCPKCKSPYWNRPKLNRNHKRK